MPLISKVITKVEAEEDVQSCSKCDRVKASKCTEQQFLKSVSVWIKKPHVVNRRLCGTKIVTLLRVDSKDEVYKAVDSYWEYYTREFKADEDLKNSLHFTDLVDELTNFTVIIRELIPKSEFFPKLLEAVVFDKQNAKVSFKPITQDCSGKIEDLKPTKELMYQIGLHKDEEHSLESVQCNKIRLSWSCDHNEKEQPRRQITSQWLSKVLLEKLVNWSQISDISTSVTSLQLVDVDKYKETYVRLKNTYGRELVKNWTERTDPKKFVFEDVAIAAYLLLIWEGEMKVKNLSHKQSFVDLGCGNGLLVYILTKEGHKGFGIDLRKRKIWDTFGPDINLKEEAISPSSNHLYPDCDWIIGNHSDELTPWIPVIAARSSYNTSFFLLPCCPHDFNGKFNQTEKGKSRYGSYMDYVKDIVVNCGFKPESDSLRIPSTKRICVIGRSRSYEQRNEIEADARRQAFIDKATIYRNNQTVEKSRKSQNEPSKQVMTDTNDTLSNTSHCLNSHSQSAIDNMQSFTTCIKDTIIEDALLEAPRKNYLRLNTEVLASFTTGTQHDSSLSVGDKRRRENLSSPDSGFDEMCFEDIDVQSSSKKRKNCPCHEDLEQPEHKDEDNCHRKDTSDVISDSSIKFKKVGSSQVVKAKKWVQDFQPRVDPGIRNCQRVPDEVKSKVVQATFSLVLSAANSKSELLNNGKTWRKGGSVSLSEVAALFDKSIMQELKKEHGGLQTLLRNHGYIFQVRGGKVELRDFTVADPWVGCNTKKIKSRRENQQDTRKTALCWYDANHPDGCPRTKEDCQFAHGLEELRSKMSKNKPG